jgi:hypothetical protein
LLLLVLGAAGYRYFPEVSQGASKTNKTAESGAPKKGSQAVPVIAAAARTTR